MFIMQFMTKSSLKLRLLHRFHLSKVELYCGNSNNYRIAVVKQARVSCAHSGYFRSYTYAYYLPELCLSNIQCPAFLQNSRQGCLGIWGGSQSEDHFIGKIEVRKDVRKVCQRFVNSPWAFATSKLVWQRDRYDFFFFYSTPSSI